MPRSNVSADTSVHSFTTEDTATSADTERRRAPKKYKWHKKFAYQKFKGWRPILTPHNAELFFVACAALLIALGVPILIASLNVVEYRVPYAFEGPFAGQDPGARQALLAQQGGYGVNYTVTLNVDKRMEAPVYVIFELGSFFQNFRRYVRSYDGTRMHDGANSGSPVSACAPFAYIDSNNDSLPINPCGQIAQSFFNDTFSLSLAGGGQLQVDDSDIAWSSDANHLYGPVAPENFNPAGGYPRGGNTTDLVLNQNQHWMVWMRPHSKVAAQKLYGRIDQSIEAGQQVLISVTNRYNTYEYSGAKTVILTTNSWVGGKNVFLGALYLATGGVCLLVALFFFAGYDLGLIWKRPYADMSNLSWLRRHATELQAQQQFMAASSGDGMPRSNGTPVQDVAADGAAAAAPPEQPKN
ncbi:hypothetical protein ABPG77_005674 [Micractinium sp. CCAP 211/92]